MNDPDITAEAPRMSTPQQLPDNVDRQLWRAVMQARSDFLQQQFGALPQEMHQLANVSPIWPGGGICHMSAPKLNNLGVCTTFGLSNVGLPPTATMDLSQPPSTYGPPRFVPRTPREMPPGLAGYGYELLVLTPQPETWPMLSLGWFVEMEILNDVDLLANVAASNGVTVADVQLGDGSRTGTFLVQPACSPILARVNLTNGLMHVLTATWITPDELEFSTTTEDGRWELLNRLLAAGVGPISILDRPSVLTR
jgi:hypothetical protein